MQVLVSGEQEPYEAVEIRGGAVSFRAPPLDKTGKTEDARIGCPLLPFRRGYWVRVSFVGKAILADFQNCCLY